MKATEAGLSVKKKNPAFFERDEVIVISDSEGGIHSDFPGKLPQKRALTPGPPVSISPEKKKSRGHGDKPRWQWGINSVLLLASLTSSILCSPIARLRSTEKSYTVKPAWTMTFSNVNKFEKIVKQKIKLKCIC